MFPISRTLQDQVSCQGQQKSRNAKSNIVHDTHSTNQQSCHTRGLSKEKPVLKMPVPKLLATIPLWRRHQNSAVSSSCITPCTAQKQVTHQTTSQFAEYSTSKDSMQHVHQRSQETLDTKKGAAQTPLLCTKLSHDTMPTYFPAYPFVRFSIGTYVSRSGPVYAESGRKSRL